MLRRRRGGTIGRTSRGCAVRVWGHEKGGSRWRVLLIAVAGLLTASALLAVAILLAGEPGALEGRILATTAVLGGFGVLALPGAMLLDQGRARRLAATLLVLCPAGAALVLIPVWHDDPAAPLEKVMGTVVIAAGLVGQTAALVALRRERAPRVVGLLFVASVVLAAAVWILASLMIWADSGEAAAGRFLGALAVLDLLSVALQPILARARAVGVRARLRITTVAGATDEVTCNGRDLGIAVATAIRQAEDAGGAVAGVEILERVAPPNR